MRAARRLFLGVMAAALLVACPAPPPQPPPQPEVADRVVVEKTARELVLFQGDRAIRRYRVALGPNPVGHKEVEGDGRTPEGVYFIDRRNPESRYHLSLHVSYPSPEDCDHAASLGRPPGGDIMVHGLPNDRGYWGPGHVRTDWTAGCIAVTNEEIEEIWALVADGTPIEIRP